MKFTVRATPVATGQTNLERACLTIRLPYRDRLIPARWHHRYTSKASGCGFYNGPGEQTLRLTRPITELQSDVRTTVDLTN